jgi:arylsulfatase A-like enzyme
MLFEGGIRVPFCVSWPKAISGGRRYDQPITALDIFPTALAAAGVLKPSSLRLDGVDLLPYLQGKNSDAPHQTLFWRYACGDDSYGYAVRDGNHKLVYSIYKGKHLLFDLAADPWERDDLAAKNPETVKRLTALYEDWRSGLVEPKWLDPHGTNVLKEESKRQQAVDAAARGDKSN